MVLTNQETQTRYAPRTRIHHELGVVKANPTKVQHNSKGHEDGEI